MLYLSVCRSSEGLQGRASPPSGAPLTCVIRQLPHHHILPAHDAQPCSPKIRRKAASVLNSSRSCTISSMPSTDNPSDVAARLGGVDGTPVLPQRASCATICRGRVAVGRNWEGNAGLTPQRALSVWFFYIRPQNCLPTSWPFFAVTDKVSSSETGHDVSEFIPGLIQKNHTLSKEPH